MDALSMARVRFPANITLHILSATLSLGLTVAAIAAQLQILAA
jgi:cytochrome bd-type quinol oxidase subunit 1